MKYERKLIKTHFIETTDKLDEVISKYVLPIVHGANIVVFCEKIIAIMQGRIVYRKDIKVGFWANFLSKFATKTPSGFSVGNPLKMQLAIDLAGLPKILLASFIGGLGKIIGIKGWFYILAGNQISQIDGFYGEAFPQYAEMGILGPKDADDVCNDLKKRYGFSCAIVDVNDLGRELLGISDDIKAIGKEVLDNLKDNPAGQGAELTPIIILKSYV
ncbi:F420-0--gamma-glutamyl ligase [Patescibacteria group bacterium]|nr:F420-0--gamma-glutamyl ligase [Patescibacteria group bacterium]